MLIDEAIVNASVANIGSQLSIRCPMDRVVQCAPRSFEFYVKSRAKRAEPRGRAGLREQPRDREAKREGGGKKEREREGE